MDDEKVVISEVARMVHVVKTNEKQRRVIRRAAKRGAKSSTGSVKANDGAAKRAVNRKRRSNNSGSIWIRFSPGLQQEIPTGEVAEKNASWRMRCSQKKREGALAAAVAYYESALTQAREAGMAGAEGQPLSEDGAQYLREQYAVAKAMLTISPVGTHRAHCVRTMTGTVDAVVHMPEASNDAAYRACLDWAMQQVVKERMALRTPAAFVLPSCDGEDESTGNASSSMDEHSLPVEEEARQLVHDIRFHVVCQREDGNENASQCIVKVKGPAGKKVTSVVATQKLANAFKVNFTQMIRKEMTPLLQKSAADVHHAPHSITGGASSPSKPVSHTQKQQAPSNHGSSKDNSKKQRGGRK